MRQYQIVQREGELLVRIVTRVDYTDYRDVGNTGVKMPFKWTMSWLDGRNVYELTNVQPNARIDAAKFAKPAVR